MWVRERKSPRLVKYGEIARFYTLSLNFFQNAIFYRVRECEQQNHRPKLYSHIAFEYILCYLFCHVFFHFSMGYSNSTTSYAYLSIYDNIKRCAIERKSDRFSSICHFNESTLYCGIFVFTDRLDCWLDCLKYFAIWMKKRCWKQNREKTAKCLCFSTWEWTHSQMAIQAAIVETYRFYCSGWNLFSSVFFSSCFNSSIIHKNDLSLNG